jgi:hypothetical protein
MNFLAYTADMRELPSGTGELAIRCTIWKTKPIIRFAVVTALIVTTEVYQSSFNLPLLLSPSLIFLLVCFHMRAVLLEVTPSVVRARQGRVRGRPDLEASRAEICAIRYCPRRIVFGGTHGQSLMAPYPFWTLEQVVQVAGVLDVPVYDCRGRFRFKTLTAEELGDGRLVRGDSAAGW